MPAPLHFYFDFISPYGYFASLRMEDIAARHGRAVEWHAMLLGVSVMKVMGLKPLMETPLKGPYVLHDVQRYLRRHRPPFGRDLHAPVGSPLPAARAFWWVKRRHPALQASMAHALYRAYWEQGRDLSTPEAVAGIELPPGIDAQWLLQGVAGEEAATILRSEVQASLDAGVFGSPTVIVDGELFWGVDKLPDVEAWLASGGW